MIDTAFVSLLSGVLAVVIGGALVASVVAAPRCPSLTSYAAAPWYLRGNPFITHGYRAGFTWPQTLWSLVWVHNETANIWTHLLGALLFMGLTVASTLELLKASDDVLHFVTVVVYCVGASTLLCLSTTFHWIGCVNAHVYELTAKLDYSGIAVMILVSFFPFMHSMFYCHPRWGIFYSACITIITVAALFVSWSPIFNKPGYNWLRAGLFIGMGLSGAVPLPHASWLSEGQAWPVVWPMILMGALYIFGAVLYAMHIPERWFPGRFNLVGHSHFLFHSFVMAAALVHYWNASGLQEWRMSVMAC